MAPMKVYLLLLDHPVYNNIYTLIEDMASIYIIEYPLSPTTPPLFIRGDRGIGIQIINDRANVTIGPII